MPEPDFETKAYRRRFSQGAVVTDPWLLQPMMFRQGRLLLLDALVIGYRRLAMKFTSVSKEPYKGLSLNKIDNGDGYKMVMSVRMCNEL